MRNHAIPFLLLLATLLPTGCARKLPVAAEPAPGTTTRYSGIVTMKGAPDCPVLIMPDAGSGETPLLPIGLDKQYLVEGMHLKFTYRPSRASSGNCFKGTPAILEDIHVIGGAPAK